MIIYVASGGSGRVDVCWPEVSLLLHGDGNFTDSSSHSISPSVTGSISAGAASGAIGGQAISFSTGSANYVSYVLSGGFLANPTGDFCIECWVKITANPFCSISGGYSAGRDEFLRLFKAPSSSSPKRVLSASCVSGTQRINWAAGSAVATTWTQGNWNHVAETRSSGTLRQFLNGVKVSETTDNSSWDFDTVQVGNVFLDTSNNVGGYIEEVRITQCARYTANFTPSTSAFPNS